MEDIARIPPTLTTKHQMDASASQNTLDHCATNPNVIQLALKEKELVSLHLPIRLSPFACVNLDMKDQVAVNVLHIQDALKMVLMVDV